MSNAEIRKGLRRGTPPIVRRAVHLVRDQIEGFRRQRPKPHQGLDHLGLNSHQIYPEGKNFHSEMTKAAERTLGGLEFDQNTGLASIGSCFAEEFSGFIRDRQLNYISVEPSSFGFSADWGRVYTVPNLRQIIDYSFNRNFPTIVAETAGHHFDPLREHNPGASSAADAEAAIRDHRHKSRAAFETASILVITLGQCEAWRDLETGMVWGRKPATEILSGAEGRYQNETFSFQDNMTELQTALQMLFAACPSLSVVLTVSPVPAYATFFDSDVITRSFANKCTLRLVADEAVKSFPDRVRYFPSCEMVLAYNPAAFRADNRHVKYGVVSRIMRTFLDGISR